MAETNQHGFKPGNPEEGKSQEQQRTDIVAPSASTQGQQAAPQQGGGFAPSGQPGEGSSEGELRPLERHKGARGTAAMDPQTRQEVARKGGLAVSRNRSHMAEIGRKGGQSVSKNREHMAKIGRKGGAASRGHRD